MRKQICLILFLSFTALAQGQLASEFFDIEIKEVDPQNAYLWNDRGSGAHQNVAFWKVNPSPGYYTLGHFTTSHHGIDKNENRNPPVTITLKPKSNHSSLLAKPLDYEFIWNDAGSGADDDVTVWRMKCPSGYVSLGDMVSNGPKPTSEACRCIKKQAINAKGEQVRLVSRAKYLDFKSEGETNPKAFWTDAGSGAKRDISIWLMYTDQKPPSKSQVYMVASTFRANSFHSAPPAEDCYALVLDFPENDILERVNLTKKIKLKGPQLPTEAEMKMSDIVQEYSLPFFAVKDPDYDSQLEQFRSSPTYKVRRTTTYVPIDSYEPTNDETKEFSVTTGKSDESNYSNEVGVALGVSVTVGGEAGIAVAKTAAHVTASVELSYSHSWGGATTKYEERSFTYPQTVTGGCFGVLFQAKSRYVIYRSDGSIVGSPVEVKINEFYTDEWCPEKIEKKKEEKEKKEEFKGGANTVTFTIDAPPGKTVIIEGRIEIYDGKIVSMPKPVSSNETKPVYESDESLNISSPSNIVSVGDILKSSYTKAAWVKMSSVGKNGPNNIISGDGSQHALWAPNIYGNRLSAGHNGQWGQVKAPNPLSNDWHHAAVSYSAETKTMKLFQDGKLVDTASDIPAFSIPIKNNTTVGGYWGQYNFFGEIKNVRIWDKVIPDSEIQSLFNTKPDVNLVGLRTR